MLLSNNEFHSVEKARRDMDASGLIWMAFAILIAEKGKQKNSNGNFYSPILSYYD